MLAALAASVALTGCFALQRPPPPPGVYQGWAFDACQAPSPGQMQAWLSSPFRGVGIYIGGGNKGCSQPGLNAGWVSTVANAGWHLAPLYVGLQAPCTSATRVSTISYSVPGLQGAISADDAIAQANILGLGPGTPIYFDMEAYNSADPFCVEVVRQFVTNWVNELHVRGYVAGYYSSSASGIRDEALISQNPGYSHPDAIWFANWNDRLSTFGDPFFSDVYWSAHQRLHQYHGGHVECWGGVCIDIDSTLADGPLAG
jgi:glycoside hydrolase-like protein